MSDLPFTGSRTLSAAVAWPLAPAQLAGILSLGGLPSREAASRSSLTACMVPAQPANTCSMGGKGTWINRGPAAGIAAWVLVSACYHVSVLEWYSHIWKARQGAFGTSADRNSRNSNCSINLKGGTSIELDRVCGAKDREKAKRSTRCYRALQRRIKVLEETHCHCWRVCWQPAG